MSNLIRNYKSGNKWTELDLKAYNIRVENSIDEISFFGRPINSVNLDELPHGILDIATAAVDEQDPDDEGYDLMRYLVMAMHGEKSAVDDFVMELMRKLSYRGNGRIIRARKDINLFMCGHYTHAKTDVCVMDRDRILLLVQAGYSIFGKDAPEPKLIAEAIAAFQNNRENRWVNLAKPSLEERTFPAIAMVGTKPIFYKITISETLDNAVHFGEYPDQPTIVQRFNPLPAREYTSMVNISDLILVLKCFRLFKDVMLSCMVEEVSC